MKWKIIAIIIAVLLVIMIAGKFAIDRLFSLIFLSRVADIGLDLKSALSSTLADTENTLTVNKNTLADNKNEGLDAVEEGHKQTTDKVPDVSNEEEKKEIEKNVTNGKELSKDGQNISGNENGEEKENIPEKDVTRKEDTIAQNAGEEREVQSKEEGIGETEVKEEVQSKKGTEDKEESRNTGEEVKSDNGEEIKDIVINESNNIVQDKEVPEDAGTISVTKEKIEKVEKEVSTIDKLRALDIIFRKLKSSDIEILIGMLRKGKLTQDEINTAKSIIKERVTEEEKKVLKELFNKYEYLIE